MFSRLAQTRFLSSPVMRQQTRSTTILALRKDNKTVLIGDGQVSLGDTVFKDNATKVMRIGKKKNVACGVAGSAVDALALRVELEKHVNAHSLSLKKACVELALQWRENKKFKYLQATILVCDSKEIFLVDGQGSVYEVDLHAVGSGGNFALAAARALYDTDMDAEQIADKAMDIASDMCVYTNKTFIKEVIDQHDTQDQ